MTGGIVALFLLAPLVVVPLGYRLLEMAAPGSRPPAVVLRLMPVGAGLLVVSFWLPAGPVAAVLAAPWLGDHRRGPPLLAGVRLVRDPDRFRLGVRHATDAAVAFLAVGATFAVIDRLGVQPFGFSATVILLTAVHFHFAGFVLPLAGALAYGPATDAAGWRSPRGGRGRDPDHGSRFPRAPAGELGRRCADGERRVRDRLGDDR